MSYSEDQTSPAAPFSGDGSGQIFDMPDMVATSPTTTERVVDTQSGFLVVIKRLNDRLALSIKRNIGTPPSSSVSLTPDESVQLSRILANSLNPETLEDAVAFGGDISEIALKEARAARRRKNSSKLFGTAPAESNEDDGKSAADLVVKNASLSSVHVPMKLMAASVLRAFMIPIVGVGMSLFVLGIGAGITAIKLVEKPAAPVAPAIVDPLDRVKVDTFVRNFVAEMLDFTSKTYRISQVQAMASMSPDLLEKYWTETKFPLSRRQLAALPQGASLLITEMKQERLDANNMQVDVRAQLTDAANPKIATPVNLRLTLSLDTNRQIFVSDQQDLSAVK